MHSYHASNKKNEIMIQKISKANFGNIKSKYVMQNIFLLVIKDKWLNLIKYNKKIQEKIHINTNYIKEYSQIYTPIVLEITPVYKKYGKFINIKKDEEKYFHIYFNNREGEIERNNLSEDDNATKIKIIIDYQVKSFEKLFDCCECIESILFKKFFRNTINSMNHMFSKCSSLKEIYLSSFNTENVNDMSYMFQNCSSLREINISRFNYNNITDIYGMFMHCSALEELNIPNFNANKVIDMRRMFDECSSLKKINISNFKANNKTSMNGLFWRCPALKEINFYNSKVNNADSMHNMFFGCSEELKNEIRAKYKNIREEAFR